MDYTTEALGREIRERRLAQPKMTQQDLGLAAGYQTGAGVSISRVEAGGTKPSPARLAGIALALGATPEELEAAASRRATHGHEMRTEGEAQERSIRSAKQRADAVQSIVERRTGATEDSVQRFNVHLDRACEGFFFPFFRVATQIGDVARPGSVDLRPGAQDPGSTNPAGRDRLDLAADCVLRAIGGAEHGASAELTNDADIYVTLSTMVAVGTRSAEVGRELSATSFPTLAALGRTPIGVEQPDLGAAMRLIAGALGGPLLALADALLSMRRRSKEKERELLRRVEKAEDDLRYTQRGYDAMLETIDAVSSIVEHIAVHGGRRMQRWHADLPALPTTWEELTEDQRLGFESLLRVAACQLTVTSIDAGSFLTLRGKALADHVERSQGLLAAARAEAERYV